MQHGVLHHLHIGKLAARRSEAVHIRSRLVIPRIICRSKLLGRGCLLQFHAAAVNVCLHAVGLGRDVYAQLGALHALESGEIALRRMYRHRNTITNSLGLDARRGKLTAAICLRSAVIVILRKRGVPRRIYLVYAQRAVDLRDVVVGISHWYHRTVTHKQGQFPQWSLVVVYYSAALVHFTREVVDPLAFGQVDAVADIITLVVGRRLLIYGRHEEPRAIHVLVTRSRTERIDVRPLEHHGPDHRHAVHSLMGYRIGIGHDLRLEFQIPTIDRGSRFAQSMGILFVRAPPVHVELHRREGLPLEVSRIDRKVTASEDAIHVGSDVGLAGKTRSDICRDVETYVLPLAARLVSGPHTGITLRAGPPVERDDKWTGIAAVVRHDLRNVGYAVQSERISGTDPCHVGLKHTHTRITYLLDDVALQQGAHLGFRMQVRLRPETDLDTLPAGIVAQRLQVADIAVEGLLLSVPGTVTVVGKQPSERHVVSRITVDHRTRRELIVVLLAVERLLHTAVVALALLVTLAVLEEYTLLILGPIVPVIRVQMSLIETELGQQHGIARKLVIVVQKRHGR